MESKLSSFDGWAVVEMFGHTKEVGFVTTEAFGTAVLFRCDTPELPERDFVLERPEWVDDKYAPIGAKVRRPASPAKTRLIGPGAIYSITPCTEETARKAIESFSRRPLILLELPAGEAKLLPGEEPDEDDEEGYLNDLETQSDRGV